MYRYSKILCFFSKITHCALCRIEYHVRNLVELVHLPTYLFTTSHYDWFYESLSENQYDNRYLLIAVYFYGCVILSCISCLFKMAMQNLNFGQIRC